MEIRVFQNAIDTLANKRHGSKPLKEVFSYQGLSFWWRLKNIVLEKKVRQLTPVRLQYYLHIHARLWRWKDLLVPRTPHKDTRPLLLFALTRLRPRYFRELERELGRQSIPYHFVTYSPLSPRSFLPSPEPTVTLESFYTRQVAEEEHEVRRLFHRKRHLLETVLSPYFEDRHRLSLLVRFFLEVDVPEMFRVYRMAQGALRVLRPKLVLCTQETGKHSYPVVVAVHRANMLVASLQHGFRALDPSYAKPSNPIHSPKNPLDFHMPDYFFTYGEYDRRVLIQQACFSSEQVFGVGQPRYDTLYCKMNEANLPALRTTYHLPTNKKILLWATQSHAWFNTPEANEKNAKIVFEAMARLNDSWQLAIKLHQGEDQSAPLYKKFNKIHNNLAKIFDSRVSTFDLLVASDAVVVTNSTVGTEAILADKPLLLIDSGKKADLSFYTTAGVGLLVENDVQLVGYLKKIKNYRKRFEKRRKRFLKENVNNFGFAAMATAKYLKSILAKD